MKVRKSCHCEKWRYSSNHSWPQHEIYVYCQLHTPTALLCEESPVPRMASSGMLRRVALVKTDVSEEVSASIIRVTRIGEVGTTLAVSSKWRMHPLLPSLIESLPSSQVHQERRPQNYQQMGWTYETLGTIQFLCFWTLSIILFGLIFSRQ
jgi:hypothetical protein